ncbi:peptidase S16 lon domain protein [Marinithermus hydrothermalis DSM 14884]|uniref:endopeptidase La n=2 Tax=Marinithermus TaxID=186191 RepID=F2NL67_MARHT|nr:peptidase S16 lon domain protein [Marinithermus hydrothermalis DSM 14884]
MGMRRITYDELIYETPVQEPERTNEDLPPPPAFYGQTKAKAALEHALKAETHAYLTGPSGTQKKETLLAYLGPVAATRPTPPDLLYLPVSEREVMGLVLPNGEGPRFVREVEAFLCEAEPLQTLFREAAFLEEKRRIEGQYRARQEALLLELEQEAATHGFTLHRTEDGFRLEGQDESALPELEARLEETVLAYLDLANQAERAVDELRRRWAERYLEPKRRALTARYPAAERYLDHLYALMVRAVVEDRLPESWEAVKPNLLIHHRPGGGAPVVFEPVPTLSRLVGRIEHTVEEGVLTTHAGLIRPGALHRANGGFLVLEAAEVLKHPHSWDALKRALKNGQVAIEEPGEEERVRTLGLDPEPLPVRVQVFLVGPVHVFDLLESLDEEFRELFRFRVEFDPYLDANEETVRAVAGLLAERGLKPFTLGAVARLVDEGKRWVERIDKTDARVNELLALAREAAALADGTVDRAAVEAAIQARHARVDLAERFYFDGLKQGTWLIETEGTRVGQVNGLVVIEGFHGEYGRPVRITARAAPGRDGVVSIERETNLSGPVFNKAVLTLAGYLRGQYAEVGAISATISLVFEQQYDEIEGDSAGLAELLAVLSAIGQVPLRQDLAVTGAVDQYGRVLPVGSVARKIEGFFHACRVQGLSGRQGVVFPKANAQNLTLEREVLEAVREGRFHLYAVAHVDEAIELLSGLRPTGYRGFHEQVRAVLERFHALENGSEESRSSDT